MTTSCKRGWRRASNCESQALRTTAYVLLTFLPLLITPQLGRASAQTISTTSHGPLITMGRSRMGACSSRPAIQQPFWLSISVTGKVTGSPWAFGGNAARHLSPAETSRLLQFARTLDFYKMRSMKRDAFCPNAAVTYVRIRRGERVKTVGIRGLGFGGYAHQAFQTLIYGLLTTLRVNPTAVGIPAEGSV
jgi:hypothetical protein